MAIYGKRYHESLKEFNKKEQFEHIHEVFDSINYDNLNSTISLNEIIKETRKHASSKVSKILELSDDEKEILAKWLNDKEFLVNLKYLIKTHSKNIFETKYKVGQEIKPELYKICVRFEKYYSPLKNYAVCIVIAHNNGKYNLVTVWINKKDDRHNTLYHYNYCKKEIGFSCEDCENRERSNTCFEYIQLDIEKKNSLT